MATSPAQPFADGTLPSACLHTTDPCGCVMPLASKVSLLPSLLPAQATLVCASECTAHLPDFVSHPDLGSVPGQQFYALDLPLNLTDLGSSTSTMATSNYLYQSSDSVYSLGSYLSAPSTASLTSLDQSLSGDFCSVETMGTLLPQTTDSTEFLPVEASGLFLMSNDHHQSQQPALIPDIATNIINLVSVGLPPTTDAPISLLTDDNTVEPWLTTINCSSTLDTLATFHHQNLFLASAFPTPATPFQQEPVKEPQLQPQTTTQTTPSLISPQSLVPSASPMNYTHQQVEPCFASEQHHHHPSNLTQCQANRGMMTAKSVCPSQTFTPVEHCLVNNINAMGGCHVDMFGSRSHLQSPLPIVQDTCTPSGPSSCLHPRLRSTSFDSVASSSPLSTYCGLTLPRLSHHVAQQGVCCGHNPHQITSHNINFPCSAPSSLATVSSAQQQQLWPPYGLQPSTLALETPSIASLLSCSAPPLFYTPAPSQVTDASMSSGGCDRDKGSFSDMHMFSRPPSPEIAAAAAVAAAATAGVRPYPFTPFPPPILPVPSYKRRTTTAYARWTVEEDRQLAEAVERATRRHQGFFSGSSCVSASSLDWLFISSMIPTRSSTQCHARWSKVLAEQRRHARKNGIKNSINSSSNNNNNNNNNNTSWTSSSSLTPAQTLPSDISATNKKREQQHLPQSSSLCWRPSIASSAGLTVGDEAALPSVVPACFPTTTAAATTAAIPFPVPPQTGLSSSETPMETTTTAATKITMPTMLGVLRGRWTPAEDRELTALVNEYLAEQGGLVLLPPPPLPTQLPHGGEAGQNWSIRDVFYQVMALRRPDDLEERRARGFPDWFRGSLEEYERLIDATVANIPWSQLVLRMTPLPLLSTHTEDDAEPLQEQQQGDGHHHLASTSFPRWSSPRFGHRLGVQAQARWAEALDPRVRRDPWTPIEDALLRRAVDECAKCWIKISEWMPGRTQRQCRTRWVQLTIKAERLEAKRIVREQASRRRGRRLL